MSSEKKLKQEEVSEETLNEQEDFQDQTESSYHTQTDMTKNKTLTKTVFVDINESDTVKIQLNKVNEISASLMLLMGSEELIGMSWNLCKSITTVGRSARLSDIYIQHPSISKSHFQIIKEDDKLYIIDLKSTNKTYLNEEELIPYKKMLVKNNDQIRSGSVIFKFLEAGQLESLSMAHMRDKAQTDFLTGLANRHALKVQGKEKFMTSRTFCLILFDVDCFKDINDTYGHLAGDFVLKEMSQLILQLVRDGDIVFRYGGDEFCVFSESPPSVAQTIAERIRYEVEKHEFLFENTKIPVTVSIGYSSRVLKDKKWEDVYKRADKAFYKAKKSGRNKVKFL